MWVITLHDLCNLATTSKFSYLEVQALAVEANALFMYVEAYSTSFIIFGIETQ